MSCSHVLPSPAAAVRQPTRERCARDDAGERVPRPHARPPLRLQDEPRLVARRALVDGREGDVRSEGSMPSSHCLPGRQLPRFAHTGGRAAFRGGAASAAGGRPAVWGEQRRCVSVAAALWPPCSRFRRARILQRARSPPHSQSRVPYHCHEWRQWRSGHWRQAGQRRRRCWRGCCGRAHPRHRGPAFSRQEP